MEPPYRKQTRPYCEDTRPLDPSVFILTFSVCPCLACLSSRDALLLRCYCYSFIPFLWFFIFLVPVIIAFLPPSISCLASLSPRVTLTSEASQTDMKAQHLSVRRSNAIMSAETSPYRLNLLALIEALRQLGRH